MTTGTTTTTNRSSDEELKAYVDDALLELKREIAFNLQIAKAYTDCQAAVTLEEAAAYAIAQANGAVYSYLGGTK